MQRTRLHITGASGSGTATLAMAVASAWSVPHADIDDYFWLPTDPPFTQQRPESDRVRLMQQVFVTRESWVLSGSMVRWGRAVVGRVEAVVFLTLDADTRLDRLEQRERRRRDSGQVAEAALAEFLEWAGQYDHPDFDGRSRSVHEEWLAGLTCPVLRLDSSQSVPDLCAAVLEWSAPS